MTETHTTPDLESSLADRADFGQLSFQGYGKRTGKWLWGILAVLLIGFIGWMYAHAIDTEILGFTHDDGVYAITAKALAEGKGFTLLHVVTHPAEIKYPFMYPLILSLVWLVNPHFPQNLPLMNYVTIGFAMASLGMMYLYFRNYQRFPGWLAVLSIALVASNFFFIYFFSTVMSEAPYLFFTLLTLWACTRMTGNGNTLTPAKASLLGLLCAVTFLTRVPGITLMAAIGTWLLLNRQWKNTVVFGATSLVLGILPWVLWVKTHTPKVTDLNFPIFNAYSNYGLEFAHNVSTSKNYFAGLETDVSSLLSRLLEDMFPLLPNFFKVYPALHDVPGLDDIKAVTVTLCIYLLAGYFTLQAISTLRRSFAGGRLNAAAFSIPGLYLFYYIVVITLWNYEDQMARFLIVMTPLLWLYFFKPMLPALQSLRLPVHQHPKPWAMLMLALGFCVLSIWPVQHSYTIVSRSRTQHWVESGKVKWLWNEYKNSFAYINNHLPPDAPFAVGTDTVYYLYTGHPTLYTFYASLRQSKGRFVPNAAELLMHSIDYYKMQYLVAEPHMTARVIRHPMNEVARMLLTNFPDRFQLIYATPHQAIGIYKILPPQPAKALLQPGNAGQPAQPAAQRGRGLPIGSSG